MHFILTIAILSVICLQGFADNCRLQNPVAVPKNFLEKGAYYSNATFDQVPKFTDPSAYAPGKDRLAFQIFPVFLNDVKLAFLASGISVLGKNESVGASGYYSGNFSMTGSTNSSGNETTYTFQETHHYDGHLENGRPRHAAGDAVTQSAVTISKGMITSALIQFPVYTIWEQNPFGTQVAFTGQHQTLCLQLVL
ncbi:MAG: hypothetical protein WA160_13475 [Pseudobdellovibrio sp.]